mmetsp:Transcript_76205/g.235976  ORF Transcript_76205/g.235976 Transcript_76205/m.235976 type:complete len:284 (-) Transcript_76205:262-1113(-)
MLCYILQSRQLGQLEAFIARGSRGEHVVPVPLSCAVRAEGGEEQLHVLIRAAVAVAIRDHLEHSARRVAELRVAPRGQAVELVAAKQQEDDVPLDAVALVSEASLQRFHALDAAELPRRVSVHTVRDQVHSDGAPRHARLHDISLHHLPHVGPLARAVPGFQKRTQLPVSIEAGRLQEELAQHPLLLDPLYLVARPGLIVFRHPSELDHTQGGAFQVVGQLSQLFVARLEARLIPPVLLRQAEGAFGDNLEADHGRAVVQVDEVGHLASCLRQVFTAGCMQGS